MRILLFALLLIFGCSVPNTGLDMDPDRAHGVPLGRSNHLRSGHFTYRLGSIAREGNEVRVDLRLSNGTHRSYGQVALRIVLFGDEGKIHAVRMSVGAVLAEQTKPLVARIEDVTFPVRDVTLELIYALP